MTRALSWGKPGLRLRPDLAAISRNPGMSGDGAMTRIGSFTLVSAALSVAFVIPAGGGEPPGATGSAQPAGGGVAPVGLRNPAIPGFKFPEDEATILGWVNANDQHSINKHAWGIWTALNMPSGETFEGQDLAVFETWVTPQDILDLGPAALTRSERNPRAMTFLRQFSHRPAPRATRAALSPAAVSDQSVLGFVKYDPTAAQNITTNGLFSTSKLNQLLAAGQTSVPSFPPTALALKIKTVTLSSSSLIANRYYPFPVWPGPPDPPAAFPPGKSTWKQCAWIDTQDSGPGTGTGKVDTVWNADGSSRTPETTYGLGSFLSFRLSAAAARSLNVLRRAMPLDAAMRPAATGEFVVVAGMHVTSRELTRWTWQTFWWTADPANPPSPSSPDIAADRPAQLTGAARHYGVVPGYSMVFPDQPNTGGTNVGNSVYAYNPYLEAGFDPSVLPASQPGTFNGKPVANNFGVQTNCMSCHAQACYQTANDTSVYTGDQYIDLSGPQFTGKLKVDFLWTINDFAE